MIQECKKVTLSRYPGTILFIIFIYVVFSLSAFAIEKTNSVLPIQIVAGGESHGMLDACECEHEPGGGMAKRASLVKKIRVNNEILLLDAGGFSAGGIYDEYTEGHKGDSIRTALMLQTMAVIGYDAVAIGDDDLQVGGEWLIEQAKNISLPLVCANCYVAKGRLLAPPYVIVNKAGMRIGITAVCTPERLFQIDSGIIVHDPVAALRNCWKEMCGKTDMQIILSHTGQEQSEALTRQFPECDLVVNGHRKTGVKPVTFTGSVPVMQFGFQGKSLSALVLTASKGTYSTEQIRWYDIIPELDDDTRIKTILERKTSTPVIDNNYDLYIMSQCPYAPDAIIAFLKFTASRPKIAWKIWFIGTVENDSTFISLHGPEEVADEMLWLAMQELYPEKWRSFLEIRTNSSKNSRAVIIQCGGDLKKINAWIKNNGERELLKHYSRSMRQAIESSPTLLVNNRPFDKKIDVLNLMKFECAYLQSRDSLCKSLPECSEDIDCKAPGKIGTCNKSGKCSFKNDTQFSFSVVIADSTLQHPEKMVIATTRELFPAATITILSMSSKDGRQLLAKADPQALPFYFFSSGVEHAHNFSRIEDGLKKINNGYTFKKGVVSSNYNLYRKKKSGSIILFIDPFFSGLPEIFTMLWNDTAFAQRITIQPVIFTEPSVSRPGTEEFFRQEEALRWLVMEKIAPHQKIQYLNAYSQHPGSSYWTNLLFGTDIKPDSVSRAVMADQSLLSEHWVKLISLSIKEPVTLLINNVETVAPGGAREMRRILNRLVK